MAQLEGALAPSPANSNPQPVPGNTPQKKVDNAVSQPVQKQNAPPSGDTSKQDSPVQPNWAGPSPSPEAAHNDGIPVSSPNDQNGPITGNGGTPNQNAAPPDSPPQNRPPGNANSSPGASSPPIKDNSQNSPVQLNSPPYGNNGLSNPDTGSPGPAGNAPGAASPRLPNASLGGNPPPAASPIVVATIGTPAADNHVSNTESPEATQGPTGAVAGAPPNPVHYITANGAVEAFTIPKLSPNAVYYVSGNAVVQSSLSSTAVNAVSNIAANSANGPPPTSSPTGNGFYYNSANGALTSFAIPTGTDSGAGDNPEVPAPIPSSQSTYSNTTSGQPNGNGSATPNQANNSTAGGSSSNPFRGTASGRTTQSGWALHCFLVAGILLPLWY